MHYIYTTKFSMSQLLFFLFYKYTMVYYAPHTLPYIRAKSHVYNALYTRFALQTYALRMTYALCALHAQHRCRATPNPVAIAGIPDTDRTNQT